MLTRQAGAAVCMLLVATASLSAQTEKVAIMLSGEVRVRSELDARTSGAGTNQSRDASPDGDRGEERERFVASLPEQILMRRFGHPSEIAAAPCPIGRGGL
jgi:hypothetical protein